MRQDISETREVSRLEAFAPGESKWRSGGRGRFQQSLEETMLIWFHAHPGCEAASRVQSDSHFVARAFEQLWHLVVA